MKIKIRSISTAGEVIAHDELEEVEDAIETASEYLNELCAQGDGARNNSRVELVIEDR